MNASQVMMLAIGLGVLGRWAHNEPAVPSATGVVEILFALVVISALDSGRTGPLARGFAYLFLVSVLLGNKSPITGIAKVVNKQAAKKG